MKVIKPQRLGVLTRTFENDNKFYFVVSGLVFFSFDHPTPLHEVNLWTFTARELGRDAALDQCMPKQNAELLISGKAFARKDAPQKAVAARARVGAIDKTVWVVGDRRWQFGGVASEPEPFTEMDIKWENAFGGDGYALNPLGKGSKPIKGDQGEVHPLPNVEDPKNLIKSTRDTPPPAGFGAYDFIWPQRYGKVGTYDADWLKNRFPGFAKDMDWALWNAAPADQIIKGYFKGDESYLFENMNA